MPPLAIYEINTATWLHQLSAQYKRPVSLADVPAEEWDRLAGYNCQAVWLMGVWQRSPAAIAINRQDNNFIEAAHTVLPDFDFDQDVIGSAYSISDYAVNALFGGDQALAVARQELKRRGLKLILDYVPNHLALDHPWTLEHPDYFVNGNQQDLANDPDSYVRIGDYVLAKGRDPQFDAWSDVVQLNVFSAALRQQTITLLHSVADKCDGVRCDMAMLLLNSVFSQTWRQHIEVPPETEFWADIIKATKQYNPDFIFMAEAYWNTQQQLVQLGFDYCYDKDLYDYLTDDRPKLLQEHLKLTDHGHMIHFLENHDETRAAQEFSWPQQQAAAVLINSLPGAILYYEGQFKGYRVRTPVQLARDPDQAADDTVSLFYNRLLQIFDELRHGMKDWQLYPSKSYRLNKKPTAAVSALGWRTNRRSYLTLVNWSDHEVQTHVELPSELAGRKTKMLLQTSDHQPYVELNDGQLNCQLASWQALVLEFTD